MAGRPPKEGIDYSNWDVNIFDNDRKIDKLLDSQGAVGFLIYFYLCQRAYGSKGYFYPWSYDDAATLSRKIGGGVGSETVKQTVNLCLQIGLFDKRLFDRDGILTSRGIQTRYWQVAKERKCNTINPDYWLLDAGKPNNHAPESNYKGPKSNYDASKLNYQTQKESKGKQRKGKESSAEDSAGAAPVEYGDDEAIAYRLALSEIEDTAKGIGLPVEDQHLTAIELLYAEYGKDWILEAIRRTADRPRDKHSWGYVKGILRNWRSKGGIDDAKLAEGSGGADSAGPGSGSNDYSEFGAGITRL